MDIYFIAAAAASITPISIPVSTAMGIEKFSLENYLVPNSLK